MESSKQKIESTEELRKAILDGIDAILSAPLVSRFLSEDRIKVLKAQRNYWQQDQGNALAQLLYLYSQES